MGLNLRKLESYSRILVKLEAFISRFYRRQLLKGTFLFLFFGGLLLLVVGGLEYFLWLSPGMRTVLLLTGLLLEAYFLMRYILLPLLQLLRLRKGLSLKEGSRLIGRHFGDVNDKLYNLLELSESPERSELLLASIDQRSRELLDVPFQRAIPMREAYRYARYAAIPLLLYGLIWISGKGVEFMSSYRRVVNYRMAYEPPAPFSFQLMTPTLRQREDMPFVLKVGTPGEVRPDQVRLILEGTPMIMEDAGTHFEYTFRPPLKPVRFSFEAGGFSSREYALEVIKVPVIDRFEMSFKYPAYLGQPDEDVNGSGNATVPEGTMVRWRIRTIHTDSLTYSDRDTTSRVVTADDRAEFSKRIWRSTPYAISTSNGDIAEFDRLEYQIDVVRDEFPGIKVVMQRDSLNPNLAYFAGDITDDHGLQQLRAAVYPAGREEEVRHLELPVPETSYHSFYYTFPSGLELRVDEDYVLYFEVTDNDGNRGGKSSRSQEFSLSMLNEDEMKARQLEYNRELLTGMGKSAKERERLQKELEEFQQSQKEKQEFSFDEKQKLKDFLQRQEQQEKLMEKFSKELAESVDDTEKGAEDELLKERLERQEAEARKNAALMEEIQKILDKLDREALRERMEEVSRAQQGNQRSMQQLLELTKRYYVQEMARQLSRELSKLSEEQLVVSEPEVKQDTNADAQKDLNEQFDEIRKQLGALERDNDDLSKPLPWKRNTEKEAAAAQDQQQALDGMREQQEQGDKGDSQDASPRDQDIKEEVRQKQRNAARKLKELSEELDQGTSMAGMQSLSEDADMLRQILDNLIVFSLEQEALFEVVQNQGEGPLNRSEDIRKQRELRELFQHVDDSLFALSLRQPEIGEVINGHITEVYYNIDKGLESFGENNWYRGASYQQYAITGTNELASYLAEVLDNMQQSLQPGQGQGQGADLQLPDIIQSQQDLKQKMQQSGSKGQQQGQKEGEGSGQQEGGRGDAQGQEGEGTDPGESGNGKAEGGRGSEGGDKEGEGGSGGSGLGEEEYSEFFEIYKEQQKIRQQLEKQLEDMIRDSDRKLGEQIAREMEMFEEEILRNGITQRTADRLNRIQQQLMRLENAALQQGERQERESKSNREVFNNPVITRPEAFEKDRDELEILNRQALPLRRIYQEKVRQYFGNNDSIPPSDRL